MTAHAKTAEAFSPAADLVRHTMHVLEVGSGAVAAIATAAGLGDMLVNGVSNAQLAPIFVTIGAVTGLTATFAAYFARD